MRLHEITMIVDAFPLGFRNGSIAIRYVLHHFYDRSVSILLTTKIETTNINPI